MCHRPRKSEDGNGIPVVNRKLLKNNYLKVGISARGGLEPAFRVLFSAIFHGVSLGKFHQGRKRRILVEGKLLQSVGYLRTFFLRVLIFRYPFPARQKMISRRRPSNRSSRLALPPRTVADVILLYLDHWQPAALCIQSVSRRVAAFSLASKLSRATRHSSRETTLGSPCSFVFMMFSPLRIDGDFGVQRIPSSQ